MAEVGTLTIRIVTDAEQAEQEVKQFNSRIEREQARTLRAQRMAARAATVGSLVGVGATGLRIFQATRPAAAQAAHHSARAATGAAAASTAGRAAGGVGAAFRSGASALLRFAMAHPVTAGLVVAGLGASLLLGRRGRSQNNQSSSQEPQERANAILTDILKSANQRNRSLDQMVAEQRRAEDPLGRSLAFQQQRIRNLGAAIRPSDVNRALEMQIARLERAETEAALRRQNERNDLREVFELEMTRALTLRNQVALVMQRQQENLIPDIIGAFARGLFGFHGPRPVAEEGNNPAAAALRSLFTGSFFAPAYEDEGSSPLTIANRERAQRERRLRRLMELQIMGPANVLNAAPTVRAGTDAEYAFRVQQQRQAMQGVEEQRWRQQVLVLLNEMVRLGEAPPEQAFELQVRDQLGERLRGIQ